MKMILACVLCAAAFGAQAVAGGGGQGGGGVAYHSGFESFLERGTPVSSVQFGDAGFGTFTPNGGGASFIDTVTFGGLVPNQLYQVTLNFEGTNLGSGASVVLAGGASSSLSLSLSPNGNGNGHKLSGTVSASELSTGQGSFLMTINAVNAANGANYHGTLSVSPVPEPASMAMLVSGLLVVGAAARSRRGQA